MNRFLCVSWLTCLALAASWARAEAPEPQKMDLFQARQGGYATYRIPGLVVTKAGTLLAYCEARKSASGDWGAIDLMMRRGADAGRAWGEPFKLADPPADAEPNPAAAAQKLGAAGVTLNNPVAIADPESGAVHLLYCVNYGRCFYRRSDDDARTFSPAAEITATFEKFRPEYAWKVLAVGPGHGIRLSRGPHAGRLVVPVWMSLGTGGHAHRPSCVSTIFSDDAGKTWQRGQIVATDRPDLPNPNETAAAQLADGRVMLNIRSESPRNRRLIAYSADGATGWSKPEFDEQLFEPVCFASLLAVGGGEANEGRLLFCNPDSSDAAPGKSVNKPRRKLTLRLSEDSGKTWPFARVLDPGIAGYSDLAAGPDGTVYCLYERGGVKGQMYDTEALCLARFKMDWLLAAKDAPPGR